MKFASPSQKQRNNREQAGTGDEGTTIKRLLLVCLGNICRSPMAEGAMRRAAAARGLELVIDSAGTGDWHVGNPPDARAIAAARAGGVDIAAQRARQLKPDDFRDHDLICVMDTQNLHDVRALAPPDGTADIRLFREFVSGGGEAELADPYFGEEDGFHLTWSQAVEAAEALADWLAAR